MPTLASVPKVKGQARRWDQPRRQRRSAPARVHHSGSRGPGVSRTNKLHPPSGPHHYSFSYRPHEPQYNRVWAPLYQPGSTNQNPERQEDPLGSRTLEEQNQERPYSPLPTSHCRGEPSHHRVCRNQVGSSALYLPLPPLLHLFIFLYFNIAFSSPFLLFVLYPFVSFLFFLRLQKTFLLLTCQRGSFVQP